MVRNQMSPSGNRSAALPIYFCAKSSGVMSSSGLEVSHVFTSVGQLWRISQLMSSSGWVHNPLLRPNMSRLTNQVFQIAKSLLWILTWEIAVIWQV